MVTADAIAIVDPATCAALGDVALHHVSLELHVHMARRVLTSVATLHMRRVSDAPLQQIALDVFHLKIQSVEAVFVEEEQAQQHDGEVDTDSDDSQHQQIVLPTEWSIQPFTAFGDMLVIELPARMHKQSAFQLVIRYETTPESPAVCWLEKEQTAGRTQPYMYTQGQEVLNRSFFPCQDSPSVRITYDAQVFVPAELTCVMSAQLVHSEPVLSSTSGEDTSEASSTTAQWTCFSFDMKQSIPVYLVVLAVGDLASATIGPRSSVWTEPCMLPACASEFQGILDEYLRIGERLFGEYRWERYDVLVLPPAFPYGGMENPRLTFLSPTIIAGDQSLCSTVAHEISHSWFGNLVTNATWSDFFLNEGFTMYAERRILAEAHGRGVMCLQAKIGEALLRDEIHSLGDSSPLTRLRVPLETGIDPGDCYNHCAYEKGYAFVCYLRHLVGSDEVFDEFLRRYCEHFRFQSIAAESMFAFFLASFPDLDNGHGELTGPISFSTWLHAPGLPEFTPDYSDAKEMIAASETLAFHWTASDAPVLASVLYLSEDAKRWPIVQVLHFLDCCLTSPFQDARVVLALGDQLSLWTSTNMEVAFRWAQVLIKNAVDSRLDYVASFLTRQGKQKFQIPIYRALCVSPSTALRQFAKDMFVKTSRMLHVMVRERIHALVQALPAEA